MSYRSVSAWRTLRSLSSWTHACLEVTSREGLTLMVRQVPRVFVVTRLCYR